MICFKTIIVRLILIFMLPAVEGLELKAQSPAIIPLPQSLEWNSEAFIIPDTINIYVENDDVMQASNAAVNWLNENRIHVSLKKQQFLDKRQTGIYIRLGRQRDNNSSPESYFLRVTKDIIELEADEPPGILHGISTLRQLLTDNRKITGCEIKDWPAFKWRGFMHDVGRNFISMNSLKEQVKIMSRYKLNTFHWHLTEDIAWRLDIKQYPELTQPENMIRNPGEYYTQKEAAEFVEYCKQLGVTVIPEIDMPGHSDAFERAMGVDMQSMEGTAIVKNILHEVCQLFDVPFIHIGGDEVKITNRIFLPEMINIVRSYGKEVIGWRPGGNLDDKVVQQLWTGNPKPLPGIKTLDSRHLYINHNDPLSGVIKTFNHKICDVDRGDDVLLGAILCVWPDRRIANEHDIIQKNGFYPSILAFAERSWSGGGFLEPTSSLNADNKKQFDAFQEFETRLLVHRAKYFAGIEFPYVKQTNLEWTIVEPFPNQGNLKLDFPPEDDLMESYHYKGKTHNTFVAAGGTIWLRHMWHPMIKGELDKPSHNSTAYAYSYVHSRREQEVGMWISFHNPGRANVDDTPRDGKWDYKESRIWINDMEIPPLNWSKPGRKGHSEAPLLDESYEWRKPTQVVLKEGWNKVLVKLPIGEFTSEHTRPVKWMFTAVFVDRQGINVQEVEGLKYSIKPYDL